MIRKLTRSIDTPPRGAMTWKVRWRHADLGLIGCWERGRRLRQENPVLAKRAEQGELVTLWWTGGTENIDLDEDGGGKKSKSGKRYGTLNYLATWQGLRGEDLEVDLEAEVVIVCSKAKRAVIFRRH